MSTEEQQHIFEEWIAAYRALLLKVVRAYGATAMDRDDIFQEIIIQLWRSVPSFRHDSSIPTWLYRIALNTAIKWKRNEHKHTANETLDNSLHVLQEATENNERVAWLYQQIAALDKVDRSIALLLLDGFSYREIASISGITESNVGVKISRIKKQLILTSKKQGNGI